MSSEGKQKHHPSLFCFRTQKCKKNLRNLPNECSTIPNDSHVNQSSRTLTENEIQQRQLIGQYVLSKLEAYANRSRIWQLTHSSQIRSRLLKKSRHLSRFYSVSNDFVRDSINQFFTDVDHYALKLPKIIETISKMSIESSSLFQTLKKPNNEWRKLQLERAKQVLTKINNEDLTDDELLQKYYAHVVTTLTPKPDTACSNCIAQHREQPFDLDNAYQEAEREGKDHLHDMLQSYRERATPDFEVIQEMVDLGKYL